MSNKSIELALTYLGMQKVLQYYKSKIYSKDQHGENFWIFYMKLHFFNI